MSKNEVHRVPHLIAHFDNLDLTKPLSVTDNGFSAEHILIETMVEDQNDCFAKEFDITDTRCAGCADNEVCGIKFGEAVRATVKELEKIEKYLDISDFTLIDQDNLKVWLAMKPRPVSELVQKVTEQSKSSDEYAVIQWVKRFISTDEDLYAKEGIVYTRR